MNILCVGWHESFIHNLSGLGHFLHILETKTIGLKRINNTNTWLTSTRPIPKPGRLISDVQTLRQGFKNHEFDLILALTYLDLALFKHVPLPKVYCPITMFHGEFISYALFQKGYDQKIDDHIRNYFEHYFLSFLTEPIRALEVGNTSHHGYVFTAPNGINPFDYNSYRGDIPSVLQVGNRIAERTTQFNYDLFKEVVQGIPHLLMGDNPGIPNSRPSISWEDLKESFRSHRVYLSTCAAGDDRPMQMALLEAMMTGMPVVTTPHKNSLIKDGESGFVSSDPKVLRARVQQLLCDPELSRKMGQNARKAVSEYYDYSKFKKDWENILELSTQAFKKNTLLPASTKPEPSIEWIGSFFYGGPCIFFNQQMVETLNKKHRVFPIPREPDQNVDPVTPDPIDCMKFLEVFGESMLFDNDAQLRVISPYDLSYGHLPPIPTREIQTAATFPWEYGTFPTAWIESVKSRSIHEVWTGSFQEARHWHNLGVPVEQIAILSGGTKGSLIKPLEPPPRKNTNRYSFVLMGDPFPDEGGDVTVQAYLEEFLPGDPVVLVYATTRHLEKLIQKYEGIVQHGRSPAIEYAEGNSPLFFEKLCNEASFVILVRKGFLHSRFLPQALSCGVPFCVSAYGASLDLKEWGLPFFVPAQIAFLQREQFPEPLGGEPFWGEPDITSLRRILRYAVDHPQVALSRGIVTQKGAQVRSSWDLMGETISKRLHKIKSERPLHFQKFDLTKSQEGEHWIAQGLIHLLFREWQEAVNALEQGLSICPDHPSTLAAIMEARAGLRQPESQRDIENFLKKHNPSLAEIFHATKACCLTGQKQLILKLQQNIQDTLSKLFMAQALLESGEDEEALRLVDQLGKQRDDSSAYALGSILLFRNAPRESLQRLERAVELDPSMARLRWQLPQLCDLVGAKAQK